MLSACNCLCVSETSAVCVCVCFLPNQGWENVRMCGSSVYPLLVVFASVLFLYNLRRALNRGACLSKLGYLMALLRFLSKLVIIVDRILHFKFCFSFYILKMRKDLHFITYFSVSSYSWIEFWCMHSHEPQHLHCSACSVHS